MKRAELEHLIRAAAAITGENEIIVIGSQAVLGQYPDAPAEVLVSMEADLFPRSRPDLASVIEGAIGEPSQFHETFGYYAEGADPESCTLPRGWEERLIPISIAMAPGVRGLCLELHDLLVAKLVAGREKDLDYARTCASHRLAGRGILEERLRATELDPQVRPTVEARIARAFA